MGLAAIAAYAVLGISQLLTHSCGRRTPRRTGTRQTGLGGGWRPLPGRCEHRRLGRLPLRAVVRGRLDRTLLPKGFAMAAWIGMLFGVSRQHGSCRSCGAQTLASLALAVLATALLVPAAASGNVQPLLVLACSTASNGRAEPLWIAVAASLEATPLLLVAVSLGRRRWRRAALARVPELQCWCGPCLLRPLSHYPAQVGAATGPLGGLPLAAGGRVAALLARCAWGVVATGGWRLRPQLLAAMPRWSLPNRRSCSLRLRGLPTSIGREMRASVPLLCV